MTKTGHFFKTLILSLLAIVWMVAANAQTENQPLFESPDYRIYSTAEHTRLEIINGKKAQEIYHIMRLPEIEQTKIVSGNNKFKSFSNSTSDLFFFCGTIESGSFVCYFQIKKVSSERLFESPAATSLKLNTASDSQKWSEILPARDGHNGRNISALIIENHLETYCEKSSANGETICHVTIYKNEKTELF